MAEHPKIENAPGIAWRKCSLGWEARWRPRADLVKRGLPMKTVRLWMGLEPSELDRAAISDKCIRFQGEMLVWAGGGAPIAPAFNDTLRSLIECYRTDPDSGYRKIRYKSRVFYDMLLKRLIADNCKAEGQDDEWLKLNAINARMVLRWHEGWSKNGKHIPVAHAIVGMLRTLAGFGATILESKECDRIALMLHRMKFPMGKPRSERLTADQAAAIRAKAHEMGRPSIALAQALQFELMLRQKDVIGEWVPVAEPGLSDVTHKGLKWLRGLRWEEIDDNLILRHVTSKRQKEIEVDLRNAPMVMEELARLGDRPASGPVVLAEKDGLPWGNSNFRRDWRIIATAAGVPKTVRNMDSRAGAISEATDAGAALEHVRHAATHSDIAMTQRYSRGTVEKVETVQRLRIEHRNRK